MEFPSLHSPGQEPSHSTLELEVRGLVRFTGSNGEGPGGAPHLPSPGDTPASVLPWPRRSNSSKLIPGISDGIASGVDSSCRLSR